MNHRHLASQTAMPGESMRRSQYTSPTRTPRLPRIAQSLALRRLATPEYAKISLLAVGSLADSALVRAEKTTSTPAVDVALGKVTATARRREEDSQKIPKPTTVVGSATPETQRVYKVQDLRQTLPSVNIASIHARQSSIAVHGIGNSPASDGLEGSAGVYLGNVYLGRPGMAVFDLLDIEQPELPRGPQGTLFGKNTTAGLLSISSRAPTFTPERSVEVPGGQDGYFQGIVSGTLTETLAGRVSAYRTRNDGYAKNIHDVTSTVATARATSPPVLSSRPV